MSFSTFLSSKREWTFMRACVKYMFWKMLKPVCAPVPMLVLFTTHNMLHTQKRFHVTDTANKRTTLFSMRISTWQTVSLLATLNTHFQLCWNKIYLSTIRNPHCKSLLVHRHLSHVILCSYCTFGVFGEQGKGCRQVERLLLRSTICCQCRVSAT